MKKYGSGAGIVFILQVSFVVSVAITGCSPGRTEGGSSSDSLATTSVETLPPEAIGQQPAFEGQTRAPAMQTQTPLNIEVVATGISYPWGVDFMPDNRMFITEKPGRMRIVTLTGEVSDSINGVPNVHFEQDGGLMDVVLDPDFPTTRMLYFGYSEPYDSGYLTAIASARLSEDERILENVNVIYRAAPPHSRAFHYGIRLLFDTDGYLLASFGERFFPYIRIKAQDLKSPLGKIIRLNKDGTPAPENPFADNPDAAPEVWALGFRDPQGMTWHPKTGDLWVSDHGPRGGDEIDLVNAGWNYGWPMISYGTEYSREPVNGGLTQMDGMEQPVYYWDPAVAPSGITFYYGSSIPEWHGNLFVATLRGSHLARLVVEDNRMVGEERLLADREQRLRSVVEGPDGALYVLTDTDDGQIIRITAK